MNCEHKDLTNEKGLLTCKSCGAISSWGGEFASSTEKRLLTLISSELYPDLSDLHKAITDLFAEFVEPTGLQGLTGSNYLDYTVQKLDGAITMLMAMARKFNIEVTRFNFLSLHENFVSEDDGKSWRKAEGGEMRDGSLYRLTRDGELLFKCVPAPSSEDPFDNDSRD